MRIDHLSPSKIDLFLKCGRAYAYRYGEKLIVPPNGAMTLGYTVGLAVDYNYIQKIRTHTDLPAKEVIEVFADSWETERKDCEFKDDEQPGQMLDEGVSMTGLYHKTFAPKRQPIAVQHEFSVELEIDGEDGRYIPMKAIADLIEDGAVRDLKTSRSRKSYSDLVRSIQMGIYAAAYEAVWGTLPLISYELLLRQKTPVALPVEAPGAAVDMRRLMAIIERVVRGIEEEQFMPASPMAWWCTEKWCGYWSLCQYGGKR